MDNTFDRDEALAQLLADNYSKFDFTFLQKATVSVKKVFSRFLLIDLLEMSIYAGYLRLFYMFQGFQIYDVIPSIVVMGIFYAIKLILGLVSLCSSDKRQVLVLQNTVDVIQKIIILIFIIIQCSEIFNNYATNRALYTICTYQKNSGAECDIYIRNVYGESSLKVIALNLLYTPVLCFFSVKRFFKKNRFSKN